MSVINLHPSSVPLNHFASLAIMLLWVIAMSFSLFSLRTLHQEPGILRQPRRNMYVTLEFLSINDFVSCCPSVQKGKIAPILIVCYLP
jgi:hypothetical protein